MDTVQNEQTFRVRDAKTSVLMRYTHGLVATSVGTTLIVHNYWHGLDPIMFGIGLFLFVIGLLLVYRAQDAAIEKYHQLTKGLFLKPV
jgi:hypothetical protein